MNETVRPEYGPLARSLRELIETQLAVRRDGRFVVGIGGESGSGKSVTAAELAREQTASGRLTLVLNQDDYFLRPPRTNHEHRCRDLGSVGPPEVNLALLQSHVDAFRERRRDVDVPLVDYPANRFVRRRVDFSSASTLIVEGTYVLQLERIDARIFLEATHEDTRERRRVRNRDIDAPIIDEILAIEHELIVKQIQFADIVIDREFRITRGRYSRSRSG